MLVTGATLQDAVDGAREHRPALPQALRLSPPLTGERVVPPARPPVRVPPLALHQTLLLELVKRRIQKPLPEAQRALAPPLDLLGDLEAVHRLLAEKAEDESERVSLQYVAAYGCHQIPVSVLYQLLIMLCEYTVGFRTCQGGSATGPGSLGYLLGGSDESDGAMGIPSVSAQRGGDVVQAAETKESDHQVA